MIEDNINFHVNSLDYLQYLISKTRIETDQKTYIKKILEISHAKSAMAGLINMEGQGKSTAIAEYVLNNENCYYIKVGQSYSNRTIFRELMVYLGAELPNPLTAMNVLVKHLSHLLSINKTIRKLIIIDDAGKLNHTGLGLFHELRDNTISCTSFVFVGLPYFRNDLLRWKRQGKEGISEFYRRIENWYDDIPELKKSEKIEYCKMRGLHGKQYLAEAISYSSISEIENYANRTLLLQQFDPIDDRLNLTSGKVESKFDIDLSEPG